MNFEDLQKTWQGQAPGAKVVIETEMLLREVRRNQQHFQSIIFWRDAREVGVCFAMTIYFSVWGASWHWWSLHLLAGCCLFVGGFFLVDRRIQRRRQPVNNDPLRACIESSLYQVNHQIWLLRNVFWWYLLPILIGLTAVTATFVWSIKGSGTHTMVVTTAIYVVVYGVVYGGVYWINQFAVRTRLEPRRRELETLLAGLDPKS